MYTVKLHLTSAVNAAAQLNNVVFDKYFLVFLQKLQATVPSRSYLATVFKPI